MPPRLSHPPSARGFHAQRPSYPAAAGTYDSGKACVSGRLGTAIGSAAGRIVPGSGGDLAHTSEAVVRTGDPATTVPTSAKYSGYQPPSRKAATASAFA